jgi:hypothetical protein
LLEVSFADQLLQAITHEESRIPGALDVFLAERMSQTLEPPMLTAALSGSNAFAATIAAGVVVITATIIFGHCLVDGAGAGGHPAAVIRWS